MTWGIMQDCALFTYQQPCRPVSRGVLYSFRGNLEIRRRNLRWAMSIKIKWCKLLDTYLRQDLLENELALVSTTKECATVEDRVTETNSKAPVREWFLSCHLRVSDTHMRPGTAWDYRLGNEGIYLYEGPSYGDKSQGGGERGLILFLPSLWRTSESRNHLKAPGRSFLQLQNISRPLGNRL